MQNEGFPWFSLPSKAVASRWWATAGLALTAVALSLIYVTVNEIGAFRGVTVFDSARLFVVEGRSVDSRIPYLPWTMVFYNPLYKVILFLPVLTYSKTERGVRELFRLYSGIVGITLAACVVFLLCPAEMTLRAVATDHNGWQLWHEQNMLLRLVDRPFNTWPSLHVAITALLIWW